MGCSFLDFCKDLPDYRVPGMVTYPLAEVVFTVLIGVMCGAEEWDIIELCAAEKLDFLRNYLPFEDGIAPERTLRRCFAYLDSVGFQEMFLAWVATLTGQVRGVVAIDGKTLRGTRDAANGNKALHLVSAFAHEAGLVIGQQAVDDKSNEITAIPALLEKLCIKGCIVTIDAIGTQKAIAEKIIEREADYVLALKGNQGTLASDVELYFADTTLTATGKTTTTTDMGHGRVEERQCRATDMIEWLKDLHPDWKNLRSIAAVTASRTFKTTGETSVETRFYISSLPADPAVILNATRSHWSIENNLHWVMDVAFRDDASKAREKNLALNFSIVKHTAFNLLKRVKLKLSMNAKRKKAGWNNDFLASCLHTHSVNDS